MMQHLIRPLRRVLERLLPIAAALVIVMLLAHSWSVNHVSREERSAVEADAEVQDLDAVVFLSCENGTETMDFHLGEDGMWYWMDETFPLAQETVADFADYLADFTPQTVAVRDAEPDLESYELSTPLYSLRYTTADEVTTTLYFGKSDENGTYMKTAEDDTTIYYAPQQLLSLVQTRLYELCVTPTLPTLNEETVTAFSVQGTEREVHFARYTTQADSSVTWRRGASDVTQEESFRALMDALGTLELSQCLVWKPAEDSLALCGLDAPQLCLSVEYVDAAGREESMTLRVGAQRNEESCFVLWSGQEAIYSMPSEQLAEFFAVVETA